MYTEITPWKTPLCAFKCESCFVSYMLPCHVYAKLKKINYVKHICCYIFIWMNIHIMYYYANYMNQYACPAIQTEYCIASDNCINSYMIINGSPTKCLYISNICTYDTSTCIAPNIVKSSQIWIISSLGIFYTVLCYMHYTLRKEIRNEHGLHPNQDCMASSLCSTCGLAQEYTEIL